MPKPTESSGHLPFALARASLHFRRFSDQTLRAVGLGALAPGLATLLHALEELGDCTVNQLVGKTQLPNSTLSGLLDTLEKQGLLKRRANPEDGRSWLLVLTPKGRRVCAKLDERHRLVLGLFQGVMSEKESAELTRLLEKITDCMRTYQAK